jgi:hypothetical protein
MCLKLITAALLAMALACGPALACKGDNVLFEDDFTSNDGSWSGDDNFDIFRGEARLKPPDGGSATAVYTGMPFDDADICVDVGLPQPRDPTRVFGGLIFWQDADSFYVFLVSPEGNARVTRVQNGKASHPVGLRKADSLNTAANAVNTLRISSKGSEVSTYINDKPFASFKGEPPPQGGRIGLWGQSERGAENIWSFRNLKVTEVP